MAVIDTPRPIVAVPRFSFGRITTALLHNLRAWNDAHVTRNTLSRLSEHELQDIGLCRGDIEDIARSGLRR